MATQVQFRGGTTSEHSTFTGVAREVTVDTTKKTVVVHDGSTAGGIPLAKESAVTSAAAITGGSINGTTVGASTASTGAFTTLSASSTVSGTGFSTYLASPPAIGGTTASTGRFTTVTATGLTSGRVTYAGASGLLSDSAGLTYNGASLTISSGASASALIATSTSSGGTALNIQNNGTVNALIGGYLSCIGSGSATDVAIAAYQGALAFATNGANERMRITSAGNVGIGTSSPDSFTTFPSKLVVGSGTGNQQITIYSGTTSEGNLIFADGTTGTQQYMGLLRYDHADNAMKFYTNGGTLGMTQDSSGNLGLGVTPSAWSSGYKALQLGTNTSLAGNTGGSVAILSSNAYFDGSTYVRITADSSALYQMASGSHNWRIAGSGSAGSTVSFTQAMTLDSSGNLLVGTTSGVTNGGFSFEPNYNGGGVSSAFFGHSSSGGNGNQYCVFAYNGTFIGSITQSGTTAVLYNTSSDARLKTNIVDAPSGNINSIKVRSFDWIADGSHQEYGMVAQELIEVAPYAVSKPENPDEMMGVDYSKLVPMMIKEIQDLKAEVNQLKTKIGV